MELKVRKCVVVVVVVLVAVVVVVAVVLGWAADIVGLNAPSQPLSGDSYVFDVDIVRRRSK